MQLDDVAWHDLLGKDLGLVAITKNDGTKGKSRFQLVDDSTSLEFLEETHEGIEKQDSNDNTSVNLIEERQREEEEEEEEEEEQVSYQQPTTPSFTLTHPILHSEGENGSEFDDELDGRGEVSQELQEVVCFLLWQLVLSKLLQPLLHLVMGEP